MSDRYYLTDPGHVLISGATGAGDRYGGKSSTAHWWISSLIDNGWIDIAVVIDPGSGPYSFKTYKTLRGMAQAYQSGVRRFSWQSESAVSDVVRFVDELPGSACVVFDEAWMYADDSGMLDVVRNLGNQDDPIRAIVVSQRAWDLPDSIRNSIPLKVWCGPITSEGEQYFKSSGMGHIPESVDLDPYHWLVSDGGELVETNPPVPEGFA